MPTNILPLVQGRFITPQQLQSSHPFNQVVPNPEVDMSIHEAAQVMGQAGASARFGGRKPPQELVEQAASILGRARNPADSMSLHRAAQVLGEAGAAAQTGQEPPSRALVEKAGGVMGKVMNPMDVVKAGAIQATLPADVLPPCPPGQVRIGGVCQSPRYGHSTVIGNPSDGKVPPVCPEGMVWDLVLQKCKPGKTPPPTRPPGTGKMPTVTAAPRPVPGPAPTRGTTAQNQVPGRVIAQAQPKARGGSVDDCVVVHDSTGKSHTGYWLCCEVDKDGKQVIRCVAAEITTPEDPDSTHVFQIQGRVYGARPASGVQTGDLAAPTRPQGNTHEEFCENCRKKHGYCTWDINTNSPVCHVGESVYRFQSAVPPIPPAPARIPQATMAAANPFTMPHRPQPPVGSRSMVRPLLSR